MSCSQHTYININIHVRKLHKYDYIVKNLLIVRRASNKLKMNPYTPAITYGHTYKPIYITLYN